MHSSQLRQALVALALASGSSCGNPQAPEPRGPEAPSSPEASTRAAAPGSLPATAAFVPFAAPSSAIDPRDKEGPAGEKGWVVALSSPDAQRFSRACTQKKEVSTGCHIPEGIDERRTRASAPVNACPAVGPVARIPCGGCARGYVAGEQGVLVGATTMQERDHTPAACCYAACVEPPPPMAPNAGRPLLVDGGLRTAPLLGLLSWG